MPWLQGRGAFSVSQLAFDHFPFHVWSALVTRHSRNLHANSLHYGDPMGREDFREAIAAYLRTARGVRCEAAQILIVNGSQQALDITTHVLLNSGDRVWMEEPGYRMARYVFLQAGCRIVPVPVDDEGLNVAVGIKQCRKARLAFVTPSHQYPLGVTMSASRRLQLLEWARLYGSWIIEDDYDSEYRFAGRPIASLQGLDQDSRVIYIGTLSKVLFPSLRIGYIVVPPDLIDQFLAIRHAMDIGSPDLYQGVLTDFINEGHFARHIRRTRLLYGERRRALVDCIQKEFGSTLEIFGGESGIRVTVGLQKPLRDRELSELAARQKLWLWPLSPSYVGKRIRHGFILGFGSTAAEDMPRVVRHLRSVIPRTSAHLHR